MGAGIPIFYGMTATELAKELGRGTDTIRHHLSVIRPGWSFSKDMILDVEAQTEIRNRIRKSKKKIELPERGTSQKTAAIINKPADSNEGSPVKKPVKKSEPWITAAKVRSALIDALLFGVVAGHAGLIWYECSELWGTPGMIGGGVVFLVVLAALLFATDPNLPRTSEFAMWFVFLVDCGALRVHYLAFTMKQAIGGAGDVETVAVCGFICAASFAALWMFRDSKLD